MRRLHQAPDIKHADGHWHWIRVYYHSPKKDMLITEAIWPTLLSLQKNNVQSYFQRDIVGGPNVLIGWRCSNSRRGEVIRALVDRLGRYLLARPSNQTMTAEEYYRLRLGASRWDLIDAPSDLVPNNTIVTDCPEPQITMIRDPVLKDYVRTFLCGSSAIAAKCLGYMGRRRASPEDVVWNILLAFAWIANPLNLSCTISYRSHANGFLRGANSASLRYKFEHTYALGRKSIHAAMRSSVGQLERGIWPEWGLKEYSDLIRTALLDSHRSFEQGRYNLYSFSDGISDERLGAGMRVPPNEHRRLLLFIDNSCSMRAWIVCVNLTYLFLKQIGVPAIERYWNCYMVGRAVEELYPDPMAAIREILNNSNTDHLLPLFAQRQDRYVSSERGGNQQIC